MRIELNEIFYFIIEWKSLRRRGPTERLTVNFIQGESRSHMIMQASPVPVQQV